MLALCASAALSHASQSMLSHRAPCRQRQCVEHGIGAGIRGQPEAAEHRRDRRVQHPAARLAPAERLHQVQQTAQLGRELRLDHVRPGLGRRAERRRVDARGAVDDEVDRAEARDGGVDRRPHLSGVVHVRLDHEHVVALRLHPRQPLQERPLRGRRPGSSLRGQPLVGLGQRRAAEQDEPRPARSNSASARAMPMWPSPPVTITTGLAGRSRRWPRGPERHWLVGLGESRAAAEGYRGFGRARGELGRPACRRRSDRRPHRRAPREARDAPAATPSPPRRPAPAAGRWCRRRARASSPRATSSIGSGRTVCWPLSAWASRIGASRLITAAASRSVRRVRRRAAALQQSTTPASFTGRGRTPPRPAREVLAAAGDRACTRRSPSRADDSPGRAVTTIGSRRPRGGARPRPRPRPVSLVEHEDPAPGQCVGGAASGSSRQTGR